MWAKAACGLPSVEWSDGILGERPELTVRPSDDDHIAVWLTKPELQVICERVDLDRFEYLGSCLNRTLVVLLDVLGAVSLVSVAGEASAVHH